MMWDSGVRKALKIAARAAGCDFEGFGLHSFRRANVTWRKEVVGSAIEASKIAGHATVSMTDDYRIVQLQRQDELTRAIQKRRLTHTSDRLTHRRNNKRDQRRSCRSAPRIQRKSPGSDPRECRLMRSCRKRG